MHTEFIVLSWAMAICSGLMAGTYLAFSMVIMKSLAALETAQGIEAMNAINRVILKTAFMPLFFGSTILALIMILTGLWFSGAPGAGGVFAAGFVYLLGMFVTTAAKNVPLNNALARVKRGGDHAVGVWDDYLSRWTFWNTNRTIACVATFVICIDLLA